MNLGGIPVQAAHSGLLLSPASGASLGRKARLGRAPMRQCSFFVPVNVTPNVPWLIAAFQLRFLEQTKIRVGQRGFAREQEEVGSTL